MAEHPDFQADWCKRILQAEGTQLIDDIPASMTGKVSNSFFRRTLHAGDAIRAYICFSRPCKEPEAVLGREDCYLISVGEGADGATGRSHGGFNFTLLDHVAGCCAFNEVIRKAKSGTVPAATATATATMEFKAALSTPAVVLIRAWVIELSGRKFWVRAVVQDSEGKVLTSAKSLFIAARPAVL